jgi:hypothetical protein
LNAELAEKLRAKEWLISATLLIFHHLQEADPM